MKETFSEDMFNNAEYRMKKMKHSNSLQTTLNERMILKIVQLKRNIHTE